MRRAAMRSLGLILRREFIAYFTSPVAYAVLAVFFVLSGIFFFGQLSEFVSLSTRPGGAVVDVNQQLIRPYLYSLSVMILFLLPLVSMRLVAEEVRQGTLEVLLTTPVSEWIITLGKYLASVGMFAVMLVGAVIHTAILFAFGNPEWGPLLTGFLGLLVTGAAYLALGLFFSTLTQNQVVAAAASFAMFLSLWLFHWLGRVTTGTLSEILTYVSFVEHFDPFGKGVLSTADFVFYLSLIFLGLYAAAQSVLARRWKT
jgi:ABC-2 type transport system permease protein